jgi:MscS family membrane protein
MKNKFYSSLVLFCLILLQQLDAQTLKLKGPPNSPVEQQPPLEDLLGRSTPRGTAFGFIKAAQGQSFERAAEYLDSRLKPRDRQELARKLFVVVDRKLSLSLSSLSNKPEGDLEDGLPTSRERIGIVKSESGDVEILLDRVQRGKDNPIWQFSSATLQGIPGLYEEVKPLWFEPYVPERLRTIQWLSIPLYRWIVFPLIIPLIFGFAALFARILTLLLRPLLRRLTREEQHRRLATMAGPLRLQVLALFFFGAVPLSINLIARRFFHHVAVTLTVIALCWLLMRLLDLVAELTVKHLQRLNRVGEIALVRLVTRLSKVTAVIGASLVLFYFAGFNLTAVLTGLGVGGLAIGFGAQKTIENLFGGIMVISDKPITVGDVCRADNFFGTVEDIGFRSTRIRTMDRTVVSIPNGQLAIMSLENFTLRDRFWFHHTIRLRYQTTGDQLRFVLAEIRNLLAGHPQVESESARTKFIQIGNLSLDIEVFAYVLETDYVVFLTIQEEFLLQIMGIVEASGTY